MDVSRIGKRKERASEPPASAKAASRHVIMVTAALGRLRKVDDGLIDVDTLRLCEHLGEALSRYLPRLDPEARNAIVDKFREVPSA